MKEPNTLLFSVSGLLPYLLLAKNMLTKLA
jgi:hypothetical protein